MTTYFKILKIGARVVNVLSRALSACRLSGTYIPGVGGPGGEAHVQVEFFR